jgi:hypothetical protein
MLILWRRIFSGIGSTIVQGLFGIWNRIGHHVVVQRSQNSYLSNMQNNKIRLFIDWVTINENTSGNPKQVYEQHIYSTS